MSVLSKDQIENRRIAAQERLRAARREINGLADAEQVLNLEAKLAESRIVRRIEQLEDRAISRLALKA